MPCKMVELGEGVGGLGGGGGKVEGGGEGGRGGVIRVWGLGPVSSVLDDLCTPLQILLFRLGLRSKRFRSQEFSIFGRVKGGGGGG